MKISGNTLEVLQNFSNINNTKFNDTNLNNNGSNAEIQDTLLNLKKSSTN